MEKSFLKLKIKVIRPSNGMGNAIKSMYGVFVENYLCNTLQHNKIFGFGCFNLVSCIKSTKQGEVIRALERKMREQNMYSKIFL